ncbi:MAG: hypothetical protein QOJ54_502 [Aliidongia sp.]|nr:hypothetical protein [Aliidongia sp.]
MPQIALVLWRRVPRRRATAHPTGRCSEPPNAGSDREKRAVSRRRRVSTWPLVGRRHAPGSAAVAPRPWRARGPGPPKPESRPVPAPLPAGSIPALRVGSVRRDWIRRTRSHLLPATKSQALHGEASIGWSYLDSSTHFTVPVHYNGLMPAGIDKSVFAGRGQSLDPARRTEGYQMTELSDGYFDVPAEEIAAVVTDFIMTAPPPRRPDPASIQWCLEMVERPQPEPYRALFRRIGAPWLWFSRLKMSDETLSALIGTGAGRWLLNRACPTSSRRKPHRADRCCNRAHRSTPAVETAGVDVGTIGRLYRPVLDASGCGPAHAMI